MSFYSSNNKKFKAYATSRRKEEEYYDDQQDQLDEMLAEKRGEVAMVDRYARLAKQVVNSFGQQVLQPSKQLAQSGTPAATDYLRDLIRTGSLSQWFDKIKNIDTKGLSKAAKIIVKDVKDPNTRSQIVQAFNDTLSSFGGEEMEKFFQRQSASRMAQAENTKSSIPSESLRKRALTASLDVINNPTMIDETRSITNSDFIDIAYKAFIDNVAGGNEEALKEIAQKLTINTSGKQGSKTQGIPSPTGTVSSDATTAGMSSMAGPPSSTQPNSSSPKNRLIDGSEYASKTYDELKEFLTPEEVKKIEDDFEQNKLNNKKLKERDRVRYDRKKEAYNLLARQGKVSTINDP